ncbi:DNA topoisomerase IB [Psychrobacter sp. FDAARGOS_221]|uniref:DNA topoisomerase IB n=1 Tax=Psychrobacter sp. FDAARGOS_221 TaxID=1975705 RepID=UPI000BB547FE|nr:DNA topoisomerase IB [Psychrobacter sp. FDAARGOS_221]PNK61628.1 DNA topoisomerase I [Psychrobacter sp. FDAARGOS_221]
MTTSRSPSTDAVPNTEQTDSRHDYQALAARAQLRYVSDDEPGYTRKRWGKGFTYKDALGNTVKDKVLRRRFESLAIPPMWSEVWICQYDDGHLQCTGRDEKGRKQYLYHQQWDKVRDDAKFDAVIGFGEVLPKLRAQIENDLEAPELSRANVLAAVVKLLETTLIRIGNSRYAKQNNSYGLSTLRSRHVSETEEGLAFDFVGKSAKEHHIELQDERLIDIVQACSDLPGYRIFKYIDEAGEKQVVESQDINEYLRTHTGHEYSAKDFRTWMASVLAASYLYEHADDEVLATEADSQQRQQLVVDMVKAVAESLGNTPSVSRASYIHPQIISRFLQADFIESYKQSRQGRSKKYQSLDEKALLAFLTTSK